VYDSNGLICGAQSCEVGFTCVEGTDNPNFGVTHHDNILISWVTVFQIYSLEGWSGNMETIQQADSYWTFLYFVPLVIGTSYVLQNFSLAIVANSFTDISEKINRSESDALALNARKIIEGFYQRSLNNESKENEEENSKKAEGIVEYRLISSEDEQSPEKKLIENPEISENTVRRYGKDSFLKQFERLDSDQAIYSNSKLANWQNRVVENYKGNNRENLLGCGAYNQTGTASASYIPDAKKVEQAASARNSKHGNIRRKTRRALMTMRQSITVNYKSIKEINRSKLNLNNTKLVLVENSQLELTSKIDFHSKKTNVLKPLTNNLEEESEFKIQNTSYLNELLNEISVHFNEYKSRFQLFNYLSQRLSANEAFFILNPKCKDIIDLMNKNDIQKKHLGSSILDLKPSNPDEPDNVPELLNNLSSFSFRVWSPGFGGIYEKYAFPIKWFITHKYSTYITLLAVLVNAGALAYDHYGISTSEAANLATINTFFTYFFAVEILLKIFGLGINEFIRDFMNIFDFIVVALGIIDLSISSFKAVTAFRAIRIFRVFRVLRVVRVFRYLAFIRKVVSGLGKSLSSIFYLFLLLALFQFIFTLLGMQVYGGQFNVSGTGMPTGFPSTGMPYANFDTLNFAFLATYQVLSTENWNDVLTSSLRSQAGPASCILLFVWIIIGNFTLLNLFLGILIDAMTDELVEPEENLLVRNKVQKKIKNIEKWKDSDSEDDENDQFDYLATNVTGIDKSLCEKSFWIFSKDNSMRAFCIRFTESEAFDWFMLIIIVTCSVKLAVDTYFLDYPSNSSTVLALGYLDDVYTIIFVLEFCLKTIAYGFVLDQNTYFRSYWNMLDFVIVVISLVDIALSNFNLPVIKVFRVLRALRSLKLIKHNYSLQVVVEAVFESIKALSNLILIILIFFLIFAILAVSILGGKLYYCTNSNISDQTTCLAEGYTWLNTNDNYDNVFSASIVLFIMMSQESWPNRMVEGESAVGVGYAIRPWAYLPVAYFYVFTLFLFNWCLLNLLTTIVFTKFEEAKKAESSIAALLLNQDQLLWTEIQKLIITAKPGIESVNIPRNKIRALLWKVSKSKSFDFAVIGVIILNMISMSMPYYEASSVYLTVVEQINTVCSFIFVVEAAIKIIGLGQVYFSSMWNRFDFCISLFSLVDIIIMFSYTNSLSFVRTGPQILRIIRVVRVTRLFRLVKSLEALQKLLLVIRYSLPGIMSVFSLVLLIFFIYAILGAYLFHNATGVLTLDNYYNFKNFNYALITLWRASTGEDYISIMYDCKNYVGSYYPIAYMISFQCIVAFLAMDLFISVILENYQELSTNPMNPLASFTADFKVFRRHWLEITSGRKTYKIDKEELIKFITLIGNELGIVKDTERLSIIKLIGSMNIEMDGSGQYYFNEVLYAVLRKKYTKKIEKRGKLVQNIMGIEEQRTRKKLKLLRDKYSEAKPVEDKQNFFINVMIIKSVFRSWKRYSEQPHSLNSITPQFSSVEFPGSNSLRSES
jgi:hypothetical protein